MDYYSPLRYPGGKGKFTPFIKSLLESNDLLDCVYIEPFCGGSGVALALLLEGYARRIIINDFDFAVAAFWKSVKCNASELIKLIENSKPTIELREQLRCVYSNPQSYSEIEVGFATFFLNRVNRSGILKAGVIGGLAQSGVWKMDARYNISDLIKRIEIIADQSDKIEVMNCDAVECLEILVRKNLYKPFAYLDPPYYHKGPDLYLNYFKKADHVRIAEFLQRLDMLWLLSYDNCCEIKDIYSFTNNSLHYKLNYSAGMTRSKGEEIMFCHENLKILFPDLVN